MLGLYFLSGFTSLIYEVLWTRRCSLIFGHSVLAASAVVSAFMLGLGLGSLAAGRYLDRRDPSPARCVRLYAGLEAAIAGWALLGLILFPGLERIYGSLDWTGWALQGARLLGAGLVVLPPAAAMGATLPFMTRACSAGRVAALYGCNTLGASLGALLCGYLLLPAYGFALTLGFTAVLNLALAALAFSAIVGEVAADHPDEPEESSAVGAWALLSVAFLAGTGSMLCQIAWTRALILSLGSSVYAFSAVLATFLAGIGLGSLLLRPGVRNLVRSLLLAGGLGLLVSAGLGFLPLFVVEAFPWIHRSGLRMLGLQLLVCTVLLVPVCAAMGAAFPACIRLYRPRPGARVSRPYGLNTLGCWAGALAAGFGLLPTIGVQATLILGSLCFVLAALLVVLASPIPRLPWLAALALVSLGAGWLPPWDSTLLSSGAAVYARSYEGASLETMENQLATPPTFYRDGLSTTVSVHSLSNGHLSLRVNGKVDASLSPPDLRTTYLLGIIPCLLQGEPRRAALVGLGGGMTLQPLTSVPSVDRVDVFELEPAVVEAQSWWSGFNGRAQSRPSVRVHVNDGRNGVQASRSRYDVIVSEPSNPWIAGVADLFSLEFYRTCRERLQPGGVMCQWFNLYGVSPREVTAVVRTFFEAFPAGSIWLTEVGDVLLIGSEKPLRADSSRLERLLAPELQRALFSLELYQPGAIWGHYLTDRGAALEGLPAAPLLRDDRPVLEFNAPLHLYEELGGQNIQLLRDLRRQPLPPGVEETPRALAEAGWAWLSLGDDAQLQRLFTTQSGPELRLLAAAVQSQRRLPVADVLSAYRRAIESGSTPHLAAGLLAQRYRQAESWRAAASLYRLALEKAPWGSESLFRRELGECLSELGEPEQAETVLRASLDLEPNAETELLLADNWRVQRPLEARRWASRAAARNSAYAPALAGRALLLLRQHEYAQAAEAYRQLLELVPNHVEGWMNLGFSLFQLQRPAEARLAFLQVLRFDPHNRAARQNLRSLP